MKSPIRPALLGIVCFSSVLQTVIFPVAGPLPALRGDLAWVALVPLLVVLLRKGPTFDLRRVRDMVAASYLCGVLWYAGTCYWVFATMHEYGKLPVPVAAIVLVLFCLYLGAYHALFGLLVALLALRTRLGRAGTLVAVPFLWVAVELARARVTSFPWNPLGASAIDNGVLMRLLPWTGGYGVSFVLAAGNALLAAWVIVRNRRLAMGMASAGAVAAISLSFAGAGTSAPLSVGHEAATLLQPNLLVGNGREVVPEPELLAVSERLSAHPAAAISPIAIANNHVSSRIILWPESPSPYVTTQPDFLRSMGGFVREQNTPAIVGATGVKADPFATPPYREYNSAALFTPEQGYAGRYDKIHLVPFGEFVPFASVFSFASGLTREVGTVDRGRSRAAIEAGGHRYGVFLCYESIFGDEVRQFVLNGAEVLVNLSDDGWYGDTSAPFQHINMARMRAIENHRWLLRDTNTGITASIDPQGRVVEWTARHTRTAVQVHFDYEQGTTFYTRHGDLFAYGCAAATVGLLLFGFIPKRVN